MKAKRRIVIILLTVVFLPALIFSVYEIGSLNNNESMIDEIYSRQLDVILTSVNSNSLDWANSWVMKMNGIFAYPQADMHKSLTQFIESNPAVKGVFYTRDTSYQNLEVILTGYMPNAYRQREIISRVLHENPKKINKLYLYLKDSYRKIEAFSSPQSPNIAYFVFVADSYRGHKILCGIVIDAKEFVYQVLSPKIQAVVEEQFVISVRSAAKNQLIYVSEPDIKEKELQVKPLWLLPDYKMGIIYKGKTIKQLVRERTNLNLIIILLLDTLLIAGVWFVLRSINTEMKLSQMRADFISNVSHELRTPLALMSVYTETILLGRIKGDKLHDYHQTIHNETTRLTGIVNKILNFSKIEEKKYKFVFEKTDVNELIQTSLQRFEFHLKNENFEQEMNFANEPLFINGDRDALLEVFINLIDNAIKYSKENKYLSISTFTDKDKVHITITDKGVGIPENDQKYVFDKFFRVTEGEQQGVRGSGLGLSIVKNIMDSHAGLIKLVSKPEHGSTFVLSFPTFTEQPLKKLITKNA